jgi:O-antigen/teichoic acid export membrane protein
VLNACTLLLFDESRPDLFTSPNFSFLLSLADTKLPSIIMLFLVYLSQKKKDKTVKFFCFQCLAIFIILSLSSGLTSNQQSFIRNFPEYPFPHPISTISEELIILTLLVFPQSFPLPKLLPHRKHNGPRKPF